MAEPAEGNPGQQVEMYRFRELLQTVGNIELPMWVIDLIYWRKVSFSAMWLIGGLATIGAVADTVTFSHIAVLIIMLMFHVMWYTVVSWFVEVPTLEEMLISMEVLMPTPEAKNALHWVALRVTHWINRWKATIKHLIFETEIKDVLLFVLVMVEFRRVLCCISLEKLVKTVYCLWFLIPMLIEVATWKLYKCYLSPEPINAILFHFLTVILMLKEYLLKFINNEPIEIHSIVQETRMFHLRNQAVIFGRLMQLARFESMLEDLDDETLIDDEDFLEDY
ncbi:hypothetical protein KR074_004526 [Drosophila pseudoananassae]|nr:hypothetical protein KR074_004526 [Drosophila pseudoananassae]